jgi:excisionase family DNA binding protein
MPADMQTAFRELYEATIPTAGAADGTEVVTSAPVVRAFEVIDTVEAAHRLGVAERTVRQRLARGRLPGQKIGRTWCVEWRTDGSDRDNRGAAIPRDERLRDGEERER